MKKISELRRLSLSQLSLARVADVERLFFDLAGQDKIRPSRKADMISEIGKMRRSRTLAAIENRNKAAEQAESAARAEERRAFHEENEAAKRRNNSIFDDMPPVPLWGEP